MTSRIVVGLLVVALVAVVAILWHPWSNETPRAGETSARQAASYWTCPMHPSVHKDGPGACPVCGMNLVERTLGAEFPDQSKSGVADVAISAAQEMRANVATSVAERSSLTLTISAPGTITYAEHLFRRLSARFPGRIEKLSATYDGQSIKAGDVIATVYSPEAISAQEEYLLAVRSDADAGLIASVRKKLARWGITDTQIDRLVATQRIDDAIAVVAPLNGVVITRSVNQGQYVNVGDPMVDIADLSSVWLNGEVYETDVRWVKPGATVTATADAWPGRTFTGRITFVSPTLTPSTRTIRFRAEFANHDGALKPEMYLPAVIHVIVPPTIVVPAGAVLSTGEHQVVWVRSAEHRYQRREVSTGASAEGMTQILSGVDVGDTVVTSGGYLIDSESKLQ